MPIDGLMLRGLQSELDPLLRNSRVIKVYQPWPWGIILRLRTPQGERRLLLSADPDLPTCHITTWNPDNPRQAPIFAMVLRKHLEPARLLHIEQPGLERVLRLTFEVHEEGGRGERLLIGEFMGRQSNLLLVDGGTGRIIDGIKRRHDRGGRELLPGRAYEPPPSPAGWGGGERLDPFRDTPEALFRTLRLAAPPTLLRDILVGRYEGIGSFAAHETLSRAGLHPEIRRGDVDLPQLQRIADFFIGWMQRIAAGERAPALFFVGEAPDVWLFPPTLMEDAPGSVQLFATLQEAADAAFQWAFRARTRERMRTDLLRRLRRLHGRAAKKLQARQGELRQAERAEHWRRYGDLLTAHLYAVPAGAATVELPDYMNEGAPVQIPLDPTVTPVENAQRYYRRYQKAKRAAQELERHVAQAQMECDYLQQTIAAVELADEVGHLEEIQDELVRQRWLPSESERAGKKTATPRSGPTRLKTPGGATVWVGRSNRQNDELTFRTARPEDIWLHTREIPGSHVILRPSAGGEPSDDDVLAAAEVAAYYSQARHSANVPVDYTRRKYVRKPPGAPPGFVTYERHRTLYVTPTRERIAAMTPDDAEVTTEGSSQPRGLR